MGAAIVLPYFDESGATVFCRLRPSNPPISKKTGKAQKYIQPTGAAVRLYVPSRTFPMLCDATARLLITEGELKALKATQEGFHCVGLSGVDCWHPRKKLTLLPELERIAWKDREVFIAFDSDAADNEHVARNERELAATLKLHGAKVRIVRIPPADDGGKMGVDDFLVAKGPAEFQKLLESAEEPPAPEAGEFMEAASDMDPAIEAEHILATVKLGDLSKLRFWRGSWYWWSSGRYSEKPPEEVRAEVVNLLNKRWLSVKIRNVCDVLEHLKAKAILPATVEPPAWLAPPAAAWLADECLATKNSIVHLPTLISGAAPCDVQASPSFLTTSATDFSLNLNALRPASWLAFLEALWGDDAESVQALQEWFGYLLTHDTRQQKLLLLVGPKRSGKGTIARILTALVLKDIDQKMKAGVDLNPFELETLQRSGGERGRREADNIYAKRFDALGIDSETFLGGDGGGMKEAQKAVDELTKALQELTKGLSSAEAITKLEAEKKELEKKFDQFRDLQIKFIETLIKTLELNHNKLAQIEEAIAKGG